MDKRGRGGLPLYFTTSLKVPVFSAAIFLSLFWRGITRRRLFTVFIPEKVPDPDLMFFPLYRPPSSNPSPFFKNVFLRSGSCLLYRGILCLYGAYFSLAERKSL